jgi:hypothetical protein
MQTGKKTNAKVFKPCQIQDGQVAITLGKIYPN